jgi:Domain of unknown function (DUF4397)
MMKRLVQGAALCGVLLSALAGCGSGGASEAPRGDVTPRQGSIRLVNAMPDSGVVSGYLYSSLFADVNFGQSSVLAKTIVARYLMSVLAPMPGGPTEVLVEDESIELSQEDEVSLLLLGPIDSHTLVRIDNVEIDFGVDLTKPETFPQPDYQIVHGSTGSGPVDVYVTEQSVALADVAPSATVSFGAVTPLANLDSTVTYRLRVTGVGSKAPVLFDSGPYTQAKLNRSIYLLLDNFGPGGETLRVANVTAGGARNFPQQTLIGTLRFANMVPDAGAVDVYLGDPATTAALFAGVDYGVTTGYEEVQPVKVTVNVTPAGDPDTIIYHTDITPVGGEARTLYTSGKLATTTVASVYMLESLRPITSAAQFGFVAAAPGAGTVDVYLTAAGQPITDSAPVLSAATLLANTTIVVGAGAFDLTVVRSGTYTELLGPERITLDAANVYDAVLFDPTGGGTPPQLTVTQQALP